MSGKFSAQDASKIKQSVRKDGYWTFFKRNLQIQQSLLNKKLNIVEIGCGTGDNCILVNKSLSYVCNKYTCIDASNEMLDFIRLEKFANTKLICQNLDSNFKLPKADIYLAKFMFHHLIHKKEILKSIYKALPKNGCLILIDKFPVYPLWFVKIIEKIFDKTNVKTKLGTHHYTYYPLFKKQIKEIGFDLEDERIKRPKSLKNSYVIRSFMVLRKTK